MTNISKQSLDGQVANEIWIQLHEVIGRLSVAQTKLFLSEMLTESERIMLAKRLAAIVLIHEKHSDYAIAKTLKISDATSRKIRSGYRRGDYKSVITGIKKNKVDYAAFVETLIDAIHFGLPRYAGPDRWKLLKK